MWETLTQSGYDSLKTRFIPTHVGNTTLGAANATNVPVHPHACGKHSTVANNVVGQDGSSPRMWETRF